MAVSVADLESAGFVRLSTDASSTTLEIAESLGTILHLDGIAKVQRLVPRYSAGVEKSCYSGLYGTQSFPFHTDMAHWHIPPRYFLLRCVEPAESVPTRFVHSRDLLKGEDELILKRALFRPRRRMDGRLTCLRLQDQRCFRWDPTFLVPVNRLATELRRQILERIDKAPCRSIALKGPGDCIVVNNWLTLHGRAAVPVGGMKRQLERVYLGAIRL